MTRLVLAVASLLALGVLTAQEASALSARNRLCVQSARQRARNAIRTSRLQFQQQQKDDIVACFAGATACAQNCTNKQTTCLSGNVSTPRDLCDASTVANDGVNSCREQFDAAIAACRDLKLPDGSPDFDAQLSCQTAARTSRFLCSQGCAAAVQPAQDRCGVDFADCLEFCG
jgi:type II secretory pathway pseudopilin PulG